MNAVHAGPSYSGLIVDVLTRFGDRVAFVDGQRTVTYRQAADLVGRFGAVLAAGPSHCGAVGWLSPNRVEAWLVQAATWLMSGRTTPLHPMASLADHVAVCDRFEIETLVVDPAFSEAGTYLAEHAATVKRVLTLGPAECGHDLLALADEVPAVQLDAGHAGEEDIAAVNFTGGTTGQPKGVMLSHRAFVQQALTTLASTQLPAVPRYLAASPISHAAFIPIMPTLMRGGTVVLQRGFDPEQWLHTVQEERINMAMTVPTMIYALLDRARPEDFRLGSLECVLYGAAPMSPSRLAEAHERIGHVFQQGYGQMEAGLITSLRIDEHDVADPDRLSSCGRPMVGVTVSLVDEGGDPVTGGTVGEVCVRSRGVMSGYWGEPEATAAAFAGDWLHTGDLARSDDDGYLYIVDRKKDMIISGGFNIYPKTVEDVLTSHPAVAVTAVIGVPDEHWGEAVKAVVTLKPGASVEAADLIALVREKKGSHHAPKSVEFVDQLPMTPVGKVDKRLVRAPYWAARSRNVS